MRAATRERMTRIMALVLVISIAFLAPKAAAQSDKYSKMAPERLCTKSNSTSPPERTTDDSPAVHCWDGGKKSLVREADG